MHPHSHGHDMHRHWAVHSPHFARHGVGTTDRTIHEHRLSVHSMRPLALGHAPPHNSMVFPSQLRLYYMLPSSGSALHFTNHVGALHPWGPHLQIHATQLGFTHHHAIRPSLNSTHQHIMSPPACPQHIHTPEQSSITIRNLVNISKDTLRMDEDKENPGSYLLAFSFDADSAGSFQICLLAKTGTDCSILPWLPDVCEPIWVSFNKGHGQKFKQAAGTGIYLEAFEAKLIQEEGPDMVCPLVVKAHAILEQSCERVAEGSDEHHRQIANVQLTQAIFKRKKNGNCDVHVLRQSVWANGVRYELQDLYGAEGANVTVQSLDTRSENACVICLSNRREIVVMPCRHMCMCNPCAAILTSKMARCPMCRQHVQSLLRIELGSRPAIKKTR